MSTPTPEEMEAMTGVKVNYDVEAIKEELSDFAFRAFQLNFPGDVADALRLLADEWDEMWAEEGGTEE